MKTEISKEFVLQMVHSMESLVENIGDFMNDNNNSFLPESKIARELSAFSRQETLYTTISQGSLLMEVIGDHIFAFVKSLTEPLCTIAPWTNVRAVLEASALSAWLFDPTIDARIRVQRGFALRHEGLIEKAKFETSYNDTLAAKNVYDRIDKVEEVANSLGFDSIRNRGGNRIGIGEKMPSYTDLAKRMLNQEAAYRLSSAILHGHTWAVQQASYRSVPVEQGSSELSYVRPLEKHIELLAIAFMTSVIFNSYSISIKYMTQLFGWDEDKLEKIMASFSRPYALLIKIRL